MFAPVVTRFRSYAVPLDGAPAAYVCRHFTCQAPVTTPGELKDALATTPA